MFSTYDIARLYTEVLHGDMTVNRISRQDIRTGIATMCEAYSPEQKKLESDVCTLPDFSKAAFRCAYLHKYAALHTYIVMKVMLEILEETEHLFLQLMRSGRFNICSVGGGPGCDALGVLAVLYDALDGFNPSVTVIDYMKGWELTFESIIEQLRYGEYDEVWSNLDENFQRNYVAADLFRKMTNESNRSIARASLVTMMKFLSAACCTKAEPMMEKIFRSMKPGALLLFIDNAAGGFTEMVERASKKNCFEAVIPARRHVLYEIDEFKNKRFGFRSCFKSRVTILLLRKPLHPQNQSLPRVPRLPQFPESDFSNWRMKENNLNHEIGKADTKSWKLWSKVDNLKNVMTNTNTNIKYPTREVNLNRDSRDTDVFAAVTSNADRQRGLGDDFSSLANRATPWSTVESQVRWNSHTPSSNSSHTPSSDNYLSDSSDGYLSDHQSTVYVNQSPHTPTSDRYLSDHQNSHTPISDRYLSDHQNPHTPTSDRYLSDHQSPVYVNQSPHTPTSDNYLSDHQSPEYVNQSPMNEEDDDCCTCCVIS